MGMQWRWGKKNTAVGVVGEEGNNSNVVVVEMDRKKKQWKCGCGGCGGGFRAERKIKKWRWSKKTELWRRRRRTRVSLKFGLLLERASLSSNSSICTICSPRIREPKLEKFVGQWKQQNWILTQRLHVKGELALITLTAWINNWILHFLLVNQSKSNAFVSLTSSRKPQCKPVKP